MTARARANALGIVCDDLQATLAFYRLLGLNLPAVADDSPHVEADLGGFRIMFDPVDTIRSFNPGWERPTGSSAMNLAFECDTAADVDDIVAAVSEFGARVLTAPFDAVWGQRYATVADPNGNAVDLYAALG